MCDRIGCTHFFPKLSEMDFSGAAATVAPPLPERRRRGQHHRMAMGPACSPAPPTPARR